MNDIKNKTILIRKKIEDHNNIDKLYEGLIVTHPLQLLINALKDYSELKNAEIDQVSQNIKISISNKLYKFKIDELQLFRDNFDWFLRIINNYGWFISRYIDENNNSYKYNKIELLNKIDELILNFNDKDKHYILILLEAKYDIELEKSKWPKYIYHSLPKILYNAKVSKIGLVPKTRNKNSYHPERIYFTTTVNEAINISKQLYNYENLNKFKDYIEKESDLYTYTILKINPNDVKGLKLFKDANLIGGLYTIINIPPHQIIKLKSIQINKKGN